MNRIRYLVPALFLLSGCSSGMQISWDWAPEAAEVTKKYKTFDVKPPEEGAGRMDNITYARIEGAVDQELRRKGMWRDISGNPDCWVVPYTTSDTKVERGGGASYGVGYSTYGGGAFGVSFSNRSTRTYQQGTLILDIVDGRENELIWTGQAVTEIKSSTSPERRQRLIDDAIRKLFQRFPPKESKSRR